MLFGIAKLLFGVVSNAHEPQLAFSLLLHAPFHAQKLLVNSRLAPSSLHELPCFQEEGNVTARPRF